MIRLLPLLALAALAPLAPASDAGAFVIPPNHVKFVPCGGAGCPDPPEVDVVRSLREAPRFDAAPGSLVTLADGIQIGVESGFAEAMAAGTPLPAADYEQGLLDAFGAWQTPELGFDITFDQLLPAEVQVYAVDETHELFQGNLFAGFALFSSGFGSRQLTSGEWVAGQVIFGGEIYIAPDRLWDVFRLYVFAGLATEEDRLARYTNLLMHEIGHILGLHHQNEYPQYNFDDDGDPYTVVHPNPFAPWEGLSVSTNIDPDAIMHAGLPTLEFASILSTELFADDRSGLNVLYPSVPEPGASLLLLVPCVAWAARQRGLRGKRLS